MQYVIVVLFLVALGLGTSTCPSDSYLPNGGLASRYFGGVNFGVWRPEGGCKDASHWAEDFSAVAAHLDTVIPREQQVFKFFSAAHCNLLTHVIPAALANGVKLWIKLFVNGGPEGYHGELNKLVANINAHRDTVDQWLAGISVGSEHVHRGSLSPDDLRLQVCAVKKRIQVELGLHHIPVGIADTFNSLARFDMLPTLAAADHVFINSYHWPNQIPESTVGTLKAQYEHIKGMAAGAAGSTDHGKPVAIGETGYPSNGGAPELFSKEHAESYWRSVGCMMIREGIPWVWFEGRDDPTKAWQGGQVERHFGLLDAALAPKYSLAC